MSGGYVVGVDLGTSTVKAAVYTLDGTSVCTASEAVPLVRRSDGAVEQDLDGFFTTAATAVRRCLGSGAIEPAAVVGLAFAGQMAGMGLVDEHHRPVAPYDSWLDTRCAPEVDDLAARAGERIARTSGCAPTISIGPKLVWWRRHQPRLCERAASMVTATSYVSGRAVGLRGDGAFVDATHLHFTAMADLAAGGWDAGLVDLCGVDPRLLPRVLASTDVVGVLDADAAAAFGLRAGVAVSAGCGDTAAGALGSGVTEPGQAFDSAGTAAVFGGCLDTFVPDVGGTLMIMRSPLSGRFYGLGYVAGAGQVVEWLGATFGRAEPDGPVDLGAVLALAAQARPGSDGVLVSPHFSGRVSPVAAAMRGSLLGVTPATTPATLVRAALESVAFEYAGYLDVLTALAPGSPVTSVVGTGGGSRSAVWNQIKADVLQVPYVGAGEVDAGTRGAAALAAVSAGCDPWAAPVDQTQTWAPDGAAADVLRRTRARYRRWTEALVDLYARDLTTP
ncbi:MAG TPA: FGGY family carbohydrate kinase [Friedmanniella sp.]